ncbi:MAG: hypothetical protein AB7V13_25005 [Pseudorhodoplanes sp.]
MKDQADAVARLPIIIFAHRIDRRLEACEQRVGVILELDLARLSPDEITAWNTVVIPTNRDFGPKRPSLTSV